jgi:hypothetical protein
MALSDLKRRCVAPVHVPAKLSNMALRGWKNEYEASFLCFNWFFESFLVRSLRGRNGGSPRPARQTMSRRRADQASVHRLLEAIKRRQGRYKRATWRKVIALVDPASCPMSTFSA